MTYSLKPFNQAAFDAAYATFHSAGPAPAVTVATIEYMAALRATPVAHNVSLTAIGNMTPDVASFAHYGDYREFTPSQAFLDDVGAHVVHLVGVTHWFG